MSLTEKVTINESAATLTVAETEMTVSDAIDTICALQEEQKAIKAKIDAHKAAVKAHLRVLKARKIESDTGHVAQFISRTEVKLDKVAVQKILSKRQWNQVTEAVTSDSFKVS